MKDLFTAEDESLIQRAITDAEKQTSGEIKVHIEGVCDIDVLDRAAQVFAELGIHKTVQRNGVLIYIAIKSHKVAIIGDKGINAVVPANFWEDELQMIIDSFSHKQYTSGLIKVITQIGNELK